MKTIKSTLLDKVAIVTGAAQGIGRAMAETLPASGASVALVEEVNEERGTVIDTRESNRRISKKRRTR